MDRNMNFLFVFLSVQRIYSEWRDITTHYLKTEVFKWHSKRQRTVWISDLWKTHREITAYLLLTLQHKSELIRIWIIQYIHHYGNSSLNTHIIFIAYVDVRDLDLQVFDDLSDKLLYKGVLLFQIRILCQTQMDMIDLRPDLVLQLSRSLGSPKNTCDTCFSFHQQVITDNYFKWSLSKNCNADAEKNLSDKLI